MNSVIDTHANHCTIEADLAWFDQVLANAIDSHFNQHSSAQVDRLLVPDLSNDDSDYAQYIKQHNFDNDERLILVLVLIPHVRPELLDTFFLQNADTARSFSEFGGYVSEHHKGVLPTIETALFLLTANKLVHRLSALRLFDESARLLTSGTLIIDHTKQSAPIGAAPIMLNSQLVTRFLIGAKHRPNYSNNFPAQRISSELHWQDLVLNAATTYELDHIYVWLHQHDVIMHEWNLKRHLQVGYRALFYGPSGTGKTLATCLLGKRLDKDVYRIDLSALVSKYIGETEKNLAQVFDQALHNQWILFFDEADSLFSQRSSGSSANDRHSNQEIAYLLQRIEQHDGLLILATNLKSNMDQAFTRRFQSVIHFTIPDASERQVLWRNLLSEQINFADFDIKTLAQDYPLSGGAMTNVLRFAAVNALQQGHQQIRQDDLLKGIARELKKEGKLTS